MAFKWFKKKDTAETGSEDVQAGNDQSALEQPLADRQEEMPSQEPAEQTPEGDADQPIEEMDQKDEPASADRDEPGESPPALTENPPEKKKIGLFGRLKKGLSKTRDILTTDIDELFSSKKQIDDDMLEALEELLITADIGIRTTMALMKKITRRASRISGPDELKEVLKQEVLDLLKNIPQPAPRGSQKPRVVLVVGVNGVGKTTTIGKLAAKATGNGERVLIVAADTFRAAAIEQLAIWSERAGADLVKHKANADPAAVAYDGMEAAVARNVDTVFVDTAGRLHTKVNLMEELKKINRTISKKIPGAPHETLLVLDATTGQNALSQAKLFNDAIGVTGLALTKLDGTAKGGIVISTCESLNIPLQYIGVGEGIDDLQEFEPKQFANALF